MLYSTPDWVVNTIVPVVTAHVGCTVTLPAGVLGALGTEFTVTVVEGEDTHVDIFLAVTVYVPGSNPVKTPVVLVQSDPSILNDKLVVFELTVIVPVVAAHVGCEVTLAIGVAGVAG